MTIRGDDRSRRMVASGLISDLLRRVGFKDKAVAEDDAQLVSTEDGMREEDGGGDDVEDSAYILAVGGDNASSMAYALIGREIIFSTIHAFRSSLLTMGGGRLHLSAVDNVAMLADLASAVYANSNTLCEGF